MRKITSIIIMGMGLIYSHLLWAGSVDRAQFTTDIVDREPVDKVETLETDTTQINYFTELKGLEGHTVTHQWVYNDQIMFEQSFTVGGPRWRVWTSKTLQPGWIGLWTVNTLDEDRSQLMTQGFQYQ